MADTLTVIWTDHRGKSWDLTSGAQGVILDTGQSGLGWPGIKETWTHGGLVRAATRLERAVHPLKVLIGWGLTGMERLALLDEWWGHANSTEHDGTLTVIRPDGSSRHRRLHLAESPETVHHFDPALHAEHGPEAWVLTGNGAYWSGPEQSARFTSADFTTGDTTPFYGPSGAGWPLYISAGAVAQGATLDNDGQGPMWLTWTLVGPLTNPRFGITGVGELAYTGTVAEGEVVEVRTDMDRRTVLETSSGDNRYPLVSGTYAPLPAGSRIPLTMVAEGLGPTSAIYVTGSTAYATAF